MQQARREVLDDGLRRLAQGPGDVHRGHGAASALPRSGLRQGLRRGRGLRPRLRPPPPRRRGHRRCASPTASGPACRHAAVGLLRAAGGPDGARASTRGCSSSTRTTCLEALRRATVERPPGHVQRRRRRRDPALAGGPPGRPADAAAARSTLVALVGRPGPAGSGWSTSRPSRCASSRTGGASTRPGCASVLGLRAARTRRAETFDDFVRGCDRRCSGPTRAARAPGASVEGRALDALRRRAQSSRAHGSASCDAVTPSRGRRRAPTVAAEDEPARRRRRRVEASSSRGPRPSERVGPRTRRWPRRLAFLRRRITGDYEVDDFGYDPELTDKVLLAALRPLYKHWFRVEVRGLENVPDDGRRADRRPTTPARSPLDCADDPARAARRAPGPPRTCGCSAPTWCSRTPVDRRVRPQDRRDPGLQRGRRAAAARAASSSASGRRASRASASRSPSATSCSGSAAAASSSAALRTGVPIIPVLDRRRRGDLPDASATSSRSPGCSGCRTSRSRRRSRWLGPLGLVPLPSKWIIEFGEPIHTDELRRRRRRRPDAGLQPHRPGARDDPAHALPAADAAPLGLLLARSSSSSVPVSRRGRRSAGRPWAGELAEFTGGWVEVLACAPRVTPTPGRVARDAVRPWPCRPARPTLAPPEPTLACGAGTLAPTPGSWTPTPSLPSRRHAAAAAAGAGPLPPPPSRPPSPAPLLAPEPPTAAPPRRRTRNRQSSRTSRPSRRRGRRG